MTITQEQYQKRPDEDINAYTARIQNLRSAEEEAARPAAVLAALNSPSVITSDNLTPTTPLNPTTYTPSTVNVGGLNVDMTDTEAQAQSQTDSLMESISNLAGESAYTTEQENAQNIAGLSQITNEQATNVQNLQLQAQDLANQYASVQDEILGETATGRTRGVIQNLTAGQQRAIAVKQRNIASQALTAYAAYNVAKGNLQVAQDAVDRAVKAKYDPIKEEIAIKKENLKLLLASPKLAAEERARAEAQLKKQNAEEKKVAEQEKLFTSMQNIYVQAAATPNMPIDVITKLKELMNKKDITIDDIAEANRLAAPYLPTSAKDYPASVQEYEYAKSQGYTGSFTDYQNEDANRKMAIAKAQVAGVDTSVANIAIKFGEKFDSAPIVKQFNEVQNKKLGIDRLLAGGSSGPSDVALVYDFMKALDPTSVVRESEYAMGAQSGNIFAGWAAKFNGYFKAEGGKLPESVKTEFQKIINQRYQAITQQYDNLYSENARKIQAITGITDTSMFLTDYKAAETTNIQPSASPGTIIKSGGLLYLVGSDGETLTPIASATS